MTKTRITKKLVALATTILMLAAMLIPATAAPGVPEGKITVHKYVGESIATTLPNNTGEPITVPSEFAPLAGAGFTVYQVDEDDVQGLINLLQPGVSVMRHSIDSTGATPTVRWELTGGIVHTATSTAPTWGEEKITPLNGEVIFDGGNATGVIPDGYYILVETTTPAGHATAPDSLIRMPMTFEAGGDNYDVHVYPKNILTNDIANKDMGDVISPVSHGDEMDFELKTKFKNSSVDNAADLRATNAPSTDPGDYGTALVRELFNVYFESISIDSEIVVRFTDAQGDFTGTALASTEYEINRTQATLTEGEIIEVKLTNAGIDRAITENAPGFGFLVRARYVGAPTAGVGVPANVSNTMESEIGAPGVTTPPTISDTVNIPTISVKGMKHDENRNPQAGATFKIATKAVNPGPADFVKDGDGNDLEVTTDDTGEFAFSNLPDYSNLDGITYYLIETAAPAGYNGGVVLPVTWENKAAYGSTYFDAQGNWAENINLNKEITVVNTPIGSPQPQSPGFSLPLTGGAGTLLFTAVGIIVMIGAAVVYLNGKKRNIEQ